MNELNFPIILSVPTPQAQAAIAKLKSAGVTCEPCQPPPMLGSLLPPDETGWQRVEKVAQTEMAGIRVLPDPITGVRLNQETLEQIIAGMTLESMKAAVIAFGNLTVPENQSNHRWCLEVEQAAVRMTEEKKLTPRELAAIMRELGRVERCILLRQINQESWFEEVETNLKKWAEL